MVVLEQCVVGSSLQFPPNHILATSGLLFSQTLEFSLASILLFCDIHSFLELGAFTVFFTCPNMT
ncbi:MAG: hypothetical protein HYW48_08945 [Deltaproteobacteria bacterium]|nr:hypothetical protein [Deltaproteobacteria bacterium]